MSVQPPCNEDGEDDADNGGDDDGGRDNGGDDDNSKDDDVVEYDDELVCESLSNFLDKVPSDTR